MINYHEFSNEFNDFVPVEEDESVEVVEEEVSDDSVEVLEDDDIVEAKVGESRCYLRSEASKDSDSLAILEPGDELMADLQESNDEWVYVCTASGKEGYVMKHLVVLP